MTVRRPRLGDVRTRVTLTSVAVVAIVLTLASVGLLLAQRTLLTRSLDDALVSEAEVLAGSLRTGGTADAPPDVAWQVTRDGAVLAASPTLAAVPAVAPEPPPGVEPRLRTVPEGAATRELDDRDLLDPPLRVASVLLGDGRAVHTVASLDEVLDAADVLAVSLAVAVPVVVLLLGGLVWVMVGRTLRPVESIRAEVQAIGVGELGRRVPAPGTDDEIDRLAATMNAMLERLDRAVATQRRFVADASHELRSPVTRLRAQLEVADADGVGTELRESLLEDVAELATLLDDLLFLARADAPGTERPTELVDLDDVVLREAARAAVDPRGVDIDSSGVSGAVVRGDRRALARAVRNLLANAVRHAETRVELALAEVAGEAVLTVTDDGPGIAPGDRERVFERFTRLDEARARDDGGAGLGLAIVREVASAHGGQASVDSSASGRGARLVLRLPAAE